MSESQNAGAIYDLGYQHYTGERRGRGYAFRTLLGFSFRSAFGLGRGEKAKSLPALVAADRKSTRLNSSHHRLSRMPSSA